MVYILLAFCAKRNSFSHYLHTLRLLLNKSWSNMKKIAAKNGMLLNNPNILSFPSKILFWGARGESFYKCLTETIETFGGGERRSAQTTTLISEMLLLRPCLPISWTRKSLLLTMPFHFLTIIAYTLILSHSSS